MVSRRTFLKKCLTLASSLALVNQSTALLTSSPVSATEKIDKSKLSKELNVYNWFDYIGETTIKDFEKEFGVKVNYDTYDSNDVLLAKLQTGAVGYDIIVPSDYMVRIMIKEEMLVPLDVNNIPNFKNIDPRFHKSPYDPENKYSIPYQWGTTGFAYNKKRIKEKLDSWNALFNEKYKGNITMLNEARDVIGAMLKYLGYSLNSAKEEELAKAKELLIKQKPLIKAYTSDQAKPMLISEEAWISHIYSGDAFAAASENETIQYIIPKEGSTIWTDNMCIPKSAPHKYTAEVFINYILRPEIGAGISNHTFFATPNKASMKHIDKEARENPSIYPSEAVLAKLEFIEDLGSEATQLWDKIWTEVKAA
jgi:spermidine/putrescine transport system substrate-binding protein